MNKLLSLGTGIASFFTPGGPLLMCLSYIFKPSRMIVWVPLLFLVFSVTFAGFAVKNYVKSAEASKALVVKQGGQIEGLQKEVQLERQSVETATRTITTYTKAVQEYAKKQQFYQAQISTIRSKLAPEKIMEKAQTNAQGAQDDLNSNYADMLSMFDSTTAAASSASGGNPDDTSKTTTSTTITRKDTKGAVVDPQKGTSGP